MKILIADDHALVREGVQSALQNAMPGITVVQAQDYQEALDQTQENSDFDLVLLDLGMPGMDRFDGLRCLYKQCGTTPIVVVSASEDAHDVQTSFECGARGYIPKSSSNEVMIIALKLVLSGGTYVPPEILGLDGHLNGAAQDSKHELSASDKLRILTRRQREVIELIAQGKTNKELSRILGLSEATVRTHLYAIYKILNVSNRTEAVHIAQGLGLIQDENN